MILIEFLYFAGNKKAMATFGEEEIEVFSDSPDGQKYDSKPQLVRAISDSIDLTTFDFSTGKCNTLLARRHKKPRTSQFDYRTQDDRSLWKLGQF
nr:methyl-CpG-binding domain protein 3-like isoform X2 [Halyomorpha halys]